jgi:hypothetical protein
MPRASSKACSGPIARQLENKWLFRVVVSHAGDKSGPDPRQPMDHPSHRTDLKAVATCSLRSMERFFS